MMASMHIHEVIDVKIDQYRIGETGETPVTKIKVKVRNSINGSEEEFSLALFSLNDEVLEVRRAD